MRRAVAGAETVFGANHPNTICLGNNLALLLDTVGKTNEASLFMQRVEMAHRAERQLGHGSGTGGADT